MKIDRRAMLKLAGAAVAGISLPGCGALGTRPRARPRVPGDILARVQVSDDRVIRTVAGLRPYRPSGFVLRPERVGEKLVIHNYGHGGCGVTLSWGTAKLALDYAAQQPHRKAAVLGCGAVGLATARLLQDSGFEVTIYARDLPPNTTSNIAGALWAPFTIAARDQRTAAFEAQLAQAARFSHRYFQGLVGERYGVRWLPLYLLSDNPAPTLPWEWAITPELYRVATLDGAEHPFSTRRARRVYLPLIEPAVYLPAVLADFRIAGGKVVVQDFADPGAVAQLKEPVVVNCTGLGAKALFRDEELTPVKGQLSFLVPQPEVNYMYIAGSYHMFPRRDGVLLGGTHERGVWSLEPDPAATERILEGHSQLAKSMR